MVFDSIGSHPNDWAGKPWTEVKQIAHRDGSILIVPVGSLEQHGHHMPTITDSLLCDSVAHAGAEKASDAVPVLITPPIWTGLSPHHLNIGATVSLQLNNMMNLLEDLADTALQNGFDAILFLNGHGGNMSLISSITKVLGPKYPEVDVLGLTYWMLSAPFINEIRDSEVGGFSHGGELETSLMMHLRPELVDEDQIEVQYYKPVYDLALKDLVVPGPLAEYRSMDYYTDTGVAGDPSLASAEKGEVIYDLLGDELAGLLREISVNNS